MMKNMRDRQCLLGFASPKALNYAHECHDVHKSDQILASFLESGSQTLAKLYVSQSTKPDLPGFRKYLDDIKNVNLKFLRDAVLTHTLGYFVFKNGVRSNDYERVMAGKEMFCPVIFNGNHPNYRRLLMYLDLDLAQMPSFLQDSSKIQW